MLSEKLGTLTDQMQRSDDDASRAHLRNIDVHLQRLLAELDAGRAQSTADIRNEIKILTKTIASIAGDGAK